jgi:hypothetical protein
MDCKLDLSNWKENLPPDKTIVSGTEIDALHSESSDQRFRVILTLRYHDTRTLLHRPVILRLLAADVTANDAIDPQLRLLRSFSSTSIELSLESAVESINILSRTSSRQGLLPPWWISIYYGKPQLRRLTRLR